MIMEPLFFPRHISIFPPLSLILQLQLEILHKGKNLISSLKVREKEENNDAILIMLSDFNLFPSSLSCLSCFLFFLPSSSSPFYILFKGIIIQKKGSRRSSSSLKKVARLLFFWWSFFRLLQCHYLFPLSKNSFSFSLFFFSQTAAEETGLFLSPLRPPLCQGSFRPCGGKEEEESASAISSLVVIMNCGAVPVGTGLKYPWLNGSFGTVSRQLFFPTAGSKERERTPLAFFERGC